MKLELDIALQVNATIEAAMKAAKDASPKDHDGARHVIALSILTGAAARVAGHIYCQIGVDTRGQSTEAFHQAFAQYVDEYEGDA